MLSVVGCMENDVLGGMRQSGLDTKSPEIQQKWVMGEDRSGGTKEHHDMSFFRAVVSAW